MGHRWCVRLVRIHAAKDVEARDDRLHDNLSQVRVECDDGEQLLPRNLRRRARPVHNVGLLRCISRLPPAGGYDSTTWRRRLVWLGASSRPSSRASPPSCCTCALRPTLRQSFSGQQAVLETELQKRGSDLDANTGEKVHRAQLRRSRHAHREYHWNGQVQCGRLQARRIDRPARKPEDALEPTVAEHIGHHDAANNAKPETLDPEICAAPKLPTIVGE
mmetsp:Transcript_123360/g.356558  ORF Transcript_123360/g.356558 Transcript_123360/m.356558 type:complete len:219 (-) Transcript_123360:708-1364(-)